MGRKGSEHDEGETRGWLEWEGEDRVDGVVEERITILALYTFDPAKPQGASRSRLPALVITKRSPWDEANQTYRRSSARTLLLLAPNLIE